MKHRYIITSILVAAILCGCTEEAETEVTETTTETSATTFNEYFLTRGWDGDELLASIFYCGEYRPLPMTLAENPDFSLSEDNVYFSDGSFAKAETDENGSITAIAFSAATAPQDFSVYGINFDSTPYDIPEKIGFANYVVGDDETEISYVFEGGGITRLVFEFKQDKLTTIYISA